MRHAKKHIPETLGLQGENDKARLVVPGRRKHWGLLKEHFGVCVWGGGGCVCLCNIET